jgi:hypothetical protein
MTEQTVYLATKLQPAKRTTGTGKMTYALGRFAGR